MFVVKRKSVKNVTFSVFQNFVNNTSSKSRHIKGKLQIEEKSVLHEELSENNVRVTKDNKVILKFLTGKSFSGTLLENKKIKWQDGDIWMVNIISQ